MPNSQSNSKLWSKLALYAAVAGASLLAMGLFSLLLDDPWADGASWPLYRDREKLLATETEYCERVRLDEALRTRLNSWSNAAFTVVGSWVMLDAATLSRDQGRPLGLWIGLGLFFLGVSRYSGRHATPRNHSG